MSASEKGEKLNAAYSCATKRSRLNGSAYGSTGEIMVCAFVMFTTRYGPHHVESFDVRRPQNIFGRVVDDMY